MNIYKYMSYVMVNRVSSALCRHDRSTVVSSDVLLIYYLLGPCRVVPRHDGIDYRRIRGTGFAEPFCELCFEPPTPTPTLTSTAYLHFRRVSRNRSLCVC